MSFSPPPSTPVVLARVAQVGTLLDDIQTVLDRAPVAASEAAAAVTGLDRLARRAQALKLRVLASTAAIETAQAGGFADTGAWLGRRTRTTGPDAARQSRLAEDLTTAEQTSTAFAAGDLGADHARVITGALAQLPATLGDSGRRAVEADLVTKAGRMDANRLRREARRALAVIEPDPVVVDAHEDQQLQSEEDRALAAARLTFHDHGDGTTSGHFTVPTLAADVLRKAIDVMTAPRRRTGRGAAELPETDPAHRRGTALVELLEHLPTDHLRTKTAATLVVQLRHDVLLGALAAAGTDTDHPVSAATARRLACTAGLIPAVFGGRSLPLDLGREQRLFTEAQRVALASRHTHCAAAGCERPYAWCELHHHEKWSRGGRTDLANAVPLCAHHHRLVHHTGYAHRDGPDGIEFVRTGRPVPSPAAVPKGAATRPPVPRAVSRPRTTAPMRT